MREIKFRAWFKKENRYCTWKEACAIIDKEASMHLGIIKLNNNDDSYFIFEQYTGHKINNNELYHKDILQNKNNDFIYIIEWIDEYAAFVLINVKDKNDELFFDEINLDFFNLIGNEHKNPELLKEV